MVPFYLTALTQASPLIQGKAKTREIFLNEIPLNFTQPSFIVSTFNRTSRFILKIFSSTTAPRYFQKKALAEMTRIFSLEEDEN